jgi:diadenosine tetraphosphate (Ap4A) HIT family hydrolase
MFVLDAAFEATSVFLTDLPLCQARLQADARFPWLVLIPRAQAAREIEDLSPADRARLMEEAVRAAVRAVGEVLGRPVEKLNLGALGNVTPQLHLHMVGRRADDPAWPGPVWGVGAAAAYDAADLDRAMAAARDALRI